VRKRKPAGGVAAVSDFFLRFIEQWLTKLFPYHRVVKNPGMNSGSSYPHNLESKATKAVAPQARSFRGFLFFPVADCLRPQERQPWAKIFPANFCLQIVFNLNITTAINAIEMQ
jgi:hypothetical protein